MKPIKMVEVTRGKDLESVHFGTAVLINSSGEILKEWGIPSEAVLIEGRSRNTYENAIETKKLLKARQIDKILLITSALHMPRALATFRTAGIDAIPSPSGYSIVNYARPQLWSGCHL